jgi:methionyl-tRNA synthetase
VNGEKMSKRLGNFIPPGPLVRELGADVLRFYLMREVAFGQDGDFSHHNLLARYHGELGNGLGNLLNRMVVSFVRKNLGGKVPRVTRDDLLAVDQELVAVAERAAEAAAKHLDDVAPHRALESVWELVLAANRYIDQTTPWKLVKDGDTKRLEVVAHTVLEALRWLSVMLSPYMPGKCDALRAQIGLDPVAPKENIDLWPRAWGEIPAGTETRAGDPLFPRIEEKDQAAMLERLGATGTAKPEGETRVSDEKMPSKKPAPDAAAPAEKQGDFIAFDDFAKVELKLGLVIEAEKVEKSDKLLKLKVEVGEPLPRQILAGIAKHYAPEDLVGRRVVIVANLAPRKMMGLESQGMVLAASDETGRLSVLGVDKDVTPGVRVS